MGYKLDWTDEEILQYALGKLDVSEYENFSINEVSTLISTSQLDMLLSRNNNKDRKAYVCFMNSINAKTMNNSICDLYDDDEATITSTSNANAERWTNMSTSERNNERIQRKKERQKKKKGANNKDNTVIEDLEDLDYNDWDDDDEAGDEHEVMSPETNGRDDGVFDDPEFMKTATEATIGKVPLLDKLPPMVQQKLLVGGVTAGASALYSYFTGEFEPQEPGETMGEYMARRNQRVKEQMRGYMDSYYTPLRNPQYAAMSDEEKNNFIDGIVGEQNDAMMATGGRVGYQVGGISSANTLAENIARNRAAQSAFQQSLAPTRENIRNQIASQSARSIAKNIAASPKTTVGNYPKFLQMTPSNISQARSLTYPQAFALETFWLF